MLDLTGLALRTLGVFIGTALNLYILLVTITVYAMALHPFQDEEMPFSSTVLIIFACLLLSLFLSIYLLAVVLFSHCREVILLFFQSLFLYFSGFPSSKHIRTIWES